MIFYNSRNMSKYVKCSYCEKIEDISYQYIDVFNSGMILKIVLGIIKNIK